MSTTASSQAARRLSFYRFEDLRPFSNELPAYKSYLQLVLKARSAARTFNVFARALRRFRCFRQVRSAALNELQSIYDHVAFGLQMPKLPVRMPLRKRAYNRGAAVTYNTGRYEIRVWVLHGPHKKKHHEWQPADIGVTAPPYLSEVLLHEIAHIHQWFFTGVSDHEHGFVRSYEIVEEVLLGFGFSPLLRDEFRFTGCPPGSVASKWQGSARQQGPKNSI